MSPQTLAEALTEAAVNVAHAAQSLHGEAELDPAKGHWTVDKESMEELNAAINAWSAAGDAFLRGGQVDAEREEPKSTMWRWSSTEGADRPLTRHDLDLDPFQAALVEFHNWSVCAARMLKVDTSTNLLTLAVAGGVHRFPTAEDCDTTAIQAERAFAKANAERIRLVRLACTAGLDTSMASLRVDHVHAASLIGSDDVGHCL